MLSDFDFITELLSKTDDDLKSQSFPNIILFQVGNLVTRLEATFSLSENNSSTLHVKASEESDSFAQVVSGQNTTLRFHPKSGLPGSACGDRARPPSTSMEIVLRRSRTVTDGEPQIDNIAYTHHVEAKPPRPLPVPF